MFALLVILFIAYITVNLMTFFLLKSTFNQNSAREFEK